MSIALSMIVRNERTNLEACIGPIRELLDEIVVVDTGSTDETVSIATKLGAHVHPFPWCDSFAAARNAALDHATADWVFILDADERIMPSQVGRLRELFDSLGDENHAYALWQVSLARDGGFSSDIPQVRIVRRRADIRWPIASMNRSAPPCSQPEA